MPSSHHPSIYQPNDPRTAQITNIMTVQFSPFPCYFPPSNKLGGEILGTGRFTSNYRILRNLL